MREEICDVIEEAQLFQADHYDISNAMRQACLAPGDSRWTLMFGQEASTERQIDRKLLLQIKKHVGQRPLFHIAALPSCFFL